MKTAISIPNPLFEIIEDYARKEKLSRSEVFVRAIQEFFSKHKNKKLLEQLNAVYSELDLEEKTLQKARRGYAARHLNKNSEW